MVKSFVSRRTVLGIPLDYIDPEQWESILMELLEQEEHSQLIFVNYSLFLKGVFNKSYRKLLNESALNIPVGKKIQRVYHFVHREKPVSCIPFKTIITLLGIMEKRFKSLYILGGRKKSILISERNLKTSFPGIKFVGRYAGFFNQQIEQDIITGIKKVSPDFLLAGSGLKGKNLWIYNNKERFGHGISLWADNCFEIFSGRASKENTIGSLIKSVLLNIIQPWKILLIFRELYINIRLFVERIKKG